MTRGGRRADAAEARRQPLPPAAPEGRFFTDNVDMAREWLSRMYEATTVEVDRDAEDRLELSIEIAQRQALTVMITHLRLGAFSLARESSFYLFTTVLEGTSEFSSWGSRFMVAPNKVGVVSSPGVHSNHVARAVTKMLALRIERSALVSHLAALIGAPVDTPPRFSPRVDLQKSHGADLSKLARLLADASARPEEPFGSPHVLAHLREAFFGTLLLGQESTVSHLLQKPPPRTDLRVVKQAEDYLAAHASEPISLADLAALTGVSLRSLERSFKAAKGCSLRDSLKIMRLEMAHRRLLAADSSTTVTQVLYASGFGHAGEFSRDYRRRFGESPSETLRRGR